MAGRGVKVGRHFGGLASEERVASASNPLAKLSWLVLSAACRLGIGVVCCWMGTR